MKKIVVVLGLCLLVVLFSGCAPKPEKISQEMVAAINAKDLETALSIYADDAVVTSVSPEPFVGKDEIRGKHQERDAGRQARICER